MISRAFVKALDVWRVMTGIVKARARDRRVLFSSRARSVRHSGKIARVAHSRLPSVFLPGNNNGRRLVASMALSGTLRSRIGSHDALASAVRTARPVSVLYSWRLTTDHRLAVLALICVLICRFLSLAGVRWQQQRRRRRGRGHGQRVGLGAELVASHLGGAAHRQIPAAQNHWQGQLCESEARQAHPHRQRGAVSIVTVFFSSSLCRRASPH